MAYEVRFEYIESTDQDLHLELYYPELPSTTIGIVYFEKGKLEEGYGLKTLRIEAGVQGSVQFILSGLKSGTTYEVRACPPNEYDEYEIETYIVDGEFSTLDSFDKPIIRKFEASKIGNKIFYSFKVENLWPNEVDGVIHKDSWTRLYGYASWDGEDVSWDGVLEKSGFVVYDESYKNLKLEATNTKHDISTGEDIVSETVSEEIDVSGQGDFSWDTPKVSGEKIRLGASEWNRFLQRINFVRLACGLSEIAFQSVTALPLNARNVITESERIAKQISDSCIITFDKIRAAVEGIIGSETTIGIPCSISDADMEIIDIKSGFKLSALFLNKIVDILNGVTFETE